ncbi:hypothetical protein [Spirosoma linguale]
MIRCRGDEYPEPSLVPLTIVVELAGTVEALSEGVYFIPVGRDAYVTD